MILRRRIIQNRMHRKGTWVRKIFAERYEKGLFNILIKDLRLYDQEYFIISFRMDSTIFELLLSWVGHLIKKYCLRRSVASPTERLSVTLRHLVTGDAHITISVGYRLSPPTVGRIIRETCQVIWNILA